MSSVSQQVAVKDLVSKCGPHHPTVTKCLANNGKKAFGHSDSGSLGLTVFSAALLGISNALKT